MSKPRWSFEQKKQYAAAWRGSGLSRQQYCELNEQYCLTCKNYRAI